MRLIDIICPISDQKVDSNTTRTIAILTVAIAATGLILNNYIIMLLLAVDFAIRSFTPGKASPLKILSNNVSKVIDNRNKILIDAAPKKFASLLGMILSLFAGLLMMLQLPQAALATTAVLIFCAALEGIFGYCLGCLIYSLITANRRI